MPRRTLLRGHSIVVLGCLISSLAAAYPGGISGKSSSGCSGCHDGANAGAPLPTTTLSGPTTVTPGSTNVYTLTIMGGPALRAGLDVSTSAGTLGTVSAGTKLLKGEVTHSSPGTMSNNSISYQFQLVAPSSGSSVVLSAAGLSCGDPDDETGDKESLTSLTVAVSAPSQGPTVATAASANPNPVTGSTAQLSVLGADPAGESSLTYTWSESAGPAGVTFSQNGSNAAKSSTATFPGAGHYTLKATLTDAAGKSASSSVDVTVSAPAQGPTVATAASANPNPVTGSSAQLSVLGADAEGEATLIYTWAASAGPSAVTFSQNGSNAAKNTTATFSHDGHYMLVATLTDGAGKSVTSSVDVTVSSTGTSEVVTVSPAGTVGVAPYGKQQFTATLSVPGQAVTWNLSYGCTGCSISSSGLFTAGHAPGGPYTVSATAGGVTGTSQVVIVNGSAPTVVISATPAHDPVLGTAVDLRVLGADSAGEPSLTYTWSSAGPGGVSFSASGNNAAKNTTATFTAAGDYQITAVITKVGGLTATSTAVVRVEQVRTSLAITPAQADVVVLRTVQLSAAALDQFGAPILSPKPIVTWVNAGEGGVNANGLFTEGAVPGMSSVVTAASGAFHATATLSAIDASEDLHPPQVSISVDGNPDAVKGVMTLHANASDARGVAAVTIRMDETPLGTVQSAGSYQLTFDSRSVADGNHVVDAVVADVEGNTALSTGVPIRVTNVIHAASGCRTTTPDAAPTWMPWFVPAVLLLALRRRR